MHRGRALGWIAFMILCSPVASVTAEEKKPANAIRVLEATYGGNCAGVAKGNVTKFIASACDGTDLCNYRVLQKYGRRPCGGMQKGLSRRLRLREKYKKPRDLRPGGRGGQGW